MTKIDYPLSHPILRLPRSCIAQCSVTYLLGDSMKSDLGSRLRHATLSPPAQFVALRIRLISAPPRQYQWRAERATTPSQPHRACHNKAKLIHIQAHRTYFGLARNCRDSIR